MLDKEEAEPEYVKCLRTIFQTEDNQEAKDMLDRLDEMENCESGSKNSMYDSNRNYDQNLRSILAETRIRNIEYVPYVLEWFSKFPLSCNSRNPISDDIANFLTNCAQDFKSESVLVEIIRVLMENHAKYLPPHSNYTNLCKGIIEVVSWMPVDKSTEVKSYEKIYNFLNMLCTNSSKNEENIALVCFIKFCEIFLKDNRPGPPSFYVVIGLRIVPEQLWKQYMDVAVKRIVSQFKDERKIVQMLSIMCQWIVEHHHITEPLSMWLCLFIKQLESNGNTRIPKELAELTLPNTFKRCLTMEQFYNMPNSENIILQLLTRIYSQQLYHSMINDFISFIDKFLPGSCHASDNWTEQVKFLCECSCTVNILHGVSKRFESHLRTYCIRCDQFTKIYLLVQKETNQYVTPHIPEESEEMEVSYPSTSSNVGRMDTGKVGLVNLGNTCYMNSVLQALAMTRQFCREVLLYKTINDSTEQTVLENLKNLFAMLKYYSKTPLAPTEILHVCRPSYFMPGQQQDSSEFLCHLLDVMYEQEKSAFLRASNNDQISTKNKVEDKEMIVVEEDSPSLNSPVNDEGKSSNMTRWTTEENLSEGASLQRKTQSLADFTQGEELAQTQNGLSDSHSDSTDSGIQSVGGEDSSSSSSASSPAGTGVPSASYLVHRVFGGELKVSYQCLQCDNESHNTDRFRDLQLCFFENLDHSEAVTVQDLIKLNYFMPEKLTGDNKYRCDKCARLCDAQRSIKIVQAPAHLILTLKHFRYDSESRLRTKLSHKVIYDETIQLPVLDQNNETYQLYAAVVHSGYSLDYGHYITYACDAKNRWYIFNDSYVAQTTIEHFKGLEPPDTPYILFYKKCTGEEDEEDAPDFSMISKRLSDYIEPDRRKYVDERRNRQEYKNSSRKGPVKNCRSLHRRVNAETLSTSLTQTACKKDVTGESKNAMYGSNRNCEQNLRSILAETRIRNIEHIPFVLEWFSKFPLSCNLRNPISDDIANFLTNCAQDFKSESVLVDIIQVLIENQTKYLPPHSNFTNLCKGIIEVLSWMPVDKTIEVKSFEKIYDFLNTLCTNSSNNEENIALVCFIKFCEIFLKDNRPEPPSFYVVIGLHVVPEQVWKQYMNVAVNGIVNQFKDERKIVQMLSIMCQWIVEHHHITEPLSMWLCSFIQQLEINGNTRIPKELAELTLPNTFKRCLAMEQFYNMKNSENIILQLLIRIYSQQLYHSMINDFISFIDNILEPCHASDNWNEQAKFLYQCSCTINILHLVSKRFELHLGASCYQCHQFARIYLLVQKETNQCVTSYIPEESDYIEPDRRKYVDERRNVKNIKAVHGRDR